jgi:PAS domain S-box-containing protein
MTEMPLGLQHELSRLAALSEMAILDTPPEQAFDEITRLAALALGAQSSAVSLVDHRRAWFKSRYCLAAPEAPREHAFCTIALDAIEPTIILDTRADPRYRDNPLTTGEAAIRFYAGAPLIMEDGYCLGTLCVLDLEPRANLADAQIEALTNLARLVVQTIEARRFRTVGEVAAQVVDVTSDAILCADQNGHITFWNRAAEAMFGHPAADAIGRSIDMIVPPRLAAAHNAGVARAAAGGATHLVGTTVELTAMKADETEFPIELALARWGSLEGGLGFAAIIRDATSRKLLEREREQAKAFLGTIIDNIPAMLFVKDVATREYLLVNRAGEEFTGHKNAAMIGRRDADLFAEGSAYEARDNAAVQGGQVDVFESEFIRPDRGVKSLRAKRIVIDGPDRPGQYILGYVRRCHRGTPGAGRGVPPRPL